MSSNNVLVGWCEWCALPDLGLPLIKAKIDTGAKTSSLHAFDIKKTSRRGEEFVRFSLHPLQGDTDLTVQCCERLVDVRGVMSSNGHIEERCVIQTQLQFANQSWSIELTLSNRDPMRFRMLLGREALKRHVLVDPGHTTLLKKVSAQKARRFYE